MVNCGCSGDSFASKATNRVALERLVLVEDDVGGREESWTILKTVWAVIEPTAGREIFVNGQLQSRVDAKIIIRYLSDIADTQVAAKCRAKFGERTYNIRAIRNLSDDMKTEGRTFQTLICVEAEPT